MSKTLETRVEALEAKTGGDERELFEIIWDRDYEPGPGVLVITWQTNQTEVQDAN